MRRKLTVVALVGMAAPCLAQPASQTANAPLPPPAAPPAAQASAPRLSMTIYNNDLALVEDRRTLDVGAGRQRLEFKDVSAQIKAETVALSGRGLTVAEQNFDYDLLTPQKMMEKAVGRQVQIVRTNPGDGKVTTETATVLSANDGVVLKIGDRIEVLRDDGAPTRVIFDKVPENLRARPTLSVSVDADRAGPREVILSYLTTGLRWKADYVALFDEARGAMDLQGWITLTNTAGTTFADVDAALVAGEVQTSAGGAGDYRPWNVRASGVRGGTEASTQARLGDFYIYPLRERTTVADQQTKQVGFVEGKGVRAAKVYEYRADAFQSVEQPQHATVALQFSNASAQGLGAPLPAGVVRIYLRDAQGAAKFAGEDRIEHTPQGSELSLKQGEAFDVTVQPTLLAQEDCGRYCTRFTMRYVLKNARPQPVTVSLRQGGLGYDGHVVKESARSRRIDAYTLGWDVPVPAAGETTLEFKAESR